MNLTFSALLKQFWPKTHKLDHLCKEFEERFDCLSKDGTSLVISLDVDDKNGIGITCGGKGLRYYFMADVSLAREIAKSLLEIADKAEAHRYE